MAIVTPFQATRYIDDINLEDVTCPPYDVLSQDMVQELRNKSAFNTVYLSKNPSDDPKHKYNHIPGILKKWHQEQMLCREEAPSYYFCEDTFTFEGKELTRKGFFALIEVSQGKTKVIPHEHTILAHILDRLDLMDQTGAHLSPIFLIADDKGAPLFDIINKVKPAKTQTFTRFDTGKEQTFGKIDDPAFANKVQTYFDTRDLLIADGHHRFKTAIEYSKKYNKPAHVLAFIVSSADPGLVLSSIHRSASCDQSPNDWIKGKTHLFTQAPLNKNTFDTSNAPFALLDYKNNKMHLYNTPEMETPSLSFQKNILEKQMNIDLRTDEGQKKMRFFKKENDLKSYTQNNKSLAFWLKPMTIQSVFRVCKRGEILPQKTTYFYPKVLDGLVFFEPNL